MNNKNLETALNDLVKSIKGITLGSIESVVIDSAGLELILNWNDHNENDPIDVDEELNNWDKMTTPQM